MKWKKNKTLTFKIHHHIIIIKFILFVLHRFFVLYLFCISFIRSLFGKVFFLFFDGRKHTKILFSCLIGDHLCLFLLLSRAFCFQNNNNNKNFQSATCTLTTHTHTRTWTKYSSGRHFSSCAYILFILQFFGHQHYS